MTDEVFLGDKVDVEMIPTVKNGAVSYVKEYKIYGSSWFDFLRDQSVHEVSKKTLQAGYWVSGSPWPYLFLLAEQIIDRREPLIIETYRHDFINVIASFADKANTRIRIINTQSGGISKPASEELIYRSLSKGEVVILVHSFDFNDWNATHKDIDKHYVTALTQAAGRVLSENKKRLWIIGETDELQRGMINLQQKSNRMDGLFCPIFVEGDGGMPVYVNTHKRECFIHIIKSGGRCIYLPYQKTRSFDDVEDDELKRSYNFDPTIECSLRKIPNMGIILSGVDLKNKTHRDDLVFDFSDAFQYDLGKEIKKDTVKLYYLQR